MRSRPPGSIELSIEELVLDGFAPGDRDGIGAAIEQGLAQLFAEQGLPAWLGQSAEVAHLDGGSFSLTPHSTAAAVGAQVAQAVYRGLLQ